MPEEYGGSGADKLYSVVQMEELARGGFIGIGFGLHSEIVAPYILHYGTEEQKKKYLPKLASRRDGRRHRHERAGGRQRPAGHQDAPRIKQADGSYLLNGSKTFITNGWHADLVIVVAKTDPASRRQGHQPAAGRARHEGLREGQAPEEDGPEGAGHRRSSSSTTCACPPKTCWAARLENNGFICLMQQLPWERMQIAVDGRGGVRRPRSTGPCSTSKERKVFGQAGGVLPEHPLQAGRAADRSAGRARVRRQVPGTACCEDKLDTATASMAKYWTTDLQCKVMDECVQLHGGYGYMWEYPITRAYADARVQRIYGGTNEIMKEVITRAMGLGAR